MYCSPWGASMPIMVGPTNQPIPYQPNFMMGPYNMFSPMQGGTLPMQFIPPPPNYPDFQNYSPYNLSHQTPIHNPGDQTNHQRMAVNTCANKQETKESSSPLTSNGKSDQVVGSNVQRPPPGFPKHPPLDWLPISWKFFFFNYHRNKL